MATNQIFNYRKEINRYKYYYQRLHIFYQKPAALVSTAVLFTLATITFFAIFAIRPTLQTISELLKKIDSQKNTLILAEKKSASLATAQHQLDLIDSHLPALTSAIPESYLAQSLLKDLEATAGKLNIPLSNLKISDLEYPVPASDNNMTQELGFTISLEATYPLIKQFINETTLLPRLISIDSVSITAPENNYQTGLDLILTSNLKCRTFYFTKAGE